MIVVTGSTGHVRPARRGRARSARRTRAPARARSRARAPAVTGAEAVAADYGDAASLARVLDRGDRVFMVSLHEGPERRVPLHRSFVGGAARAGVAHVVYLSFVNAGPSAIFLHARTHGAAEAMLRAGEFA